MSKFIKLSSRAPRPNLLRQTPRRSGDWRNYQFSKVNEPVEEADYWVALEGVAQNETVRLTSGKAILFTLEPPEIKNYHPRFLAQFDAVYTSHRNIRHSNPVFFQQGHPWIVGEKSDGRVRSTSASSDVWTYDQFLKLDFPEKPDCISAVTSNMIKVRGHIKRQEFLRKIKQAVPQLHFYGRGHTPVSDKLDAILPFRFHLVLENSSLPDYWTEKIADSYLGYAYPIYWGASNIGSYFPKDSYLQIDIQQPEKTIAEIQALIAEPLSDRRRAAMLEARELILNKYNAFETIASACDAIGTGESEIRTIRPQEDFWDFRMRQVVDRTTRWIKART
ncbi:MAG: glycosyltransferase family 10 [Pseudomonadota bacterium]